ncbi:hypothetical protein EX30DRAFT_372244 [Ascodesmis nigricans]|uniref:Uncharacterized protein n=1 Tax=Ascodesmis nigricans TaxID=341454 RepID=A0A4V3SIJ1_9PEZI|nr:hypothetical protein EX30DRAFT_372244 [Ascodesmis nigricans]
MSHTLHLLPPPLPLTSPSHHLTLTPRLTLFSPTPFLPPRPTLLSPSLTLTLTLTPAHHLPIFSRLLSHSPLFTSLGFTPTLTLVSATTAELRLLRTSAGEAAMEACLRSRAARLVNIDMSFIFAPAAGRELECLDEMDLTGRELKEMVRLADTAVRSFWGDKVARYVRLLRGDAVVNECDERVMAVGVVADVLARRIRAVGGGEGGGGGGGAGAGEEGSGEESEGRERREGMEGVVWGVVVNHVRSGRLRRPWDMNEGSSSVIGMEDRELERECKGKSDSEEQLLVEGSEIDEYALWGILGADHHDDIDGDGLNGGGNVMVEEAGMMLTSSTEISYENLLFDDDYEDEDELSAIF